MNEDMKARVEAFRTKDDYLRQRVASSPLKVQGEDLEWFRLCTAGYGRPLPTPTIDECWEWRGSVSENGHPVMILNGRRVGARRVAYSTWVRPLCSEDVVLAGCNNRLCVNPAHLGTGRPVHFDAVESSEADKRRVDGPKNGLVRHGRGDQLA